MQQTRRDFILAGSAAAMALAVPPATAQASGYPNRPIRFFAGFPPGGVADIVARIITPPLSTRLGQPVVIDNRAGAGGVIGVDSTIKSPPDGYTMGFGVSGALTSSVTLMSRLPYDPTKDIAPVSIVVSLPLVLAVSASSGINNLKDFVAAAKAAQGKFTYGTAGPGTVMNLAGELFKQMAGVEMTHVGYKGSSPAAMDLLGGQVNAAVLDLATAKPHLQSGRLKAIGLTGGKRTALAPEIQTLAEAGLPGYDFNGWFGLVMPPATPPDILTRVHTELVAVLRDPAIRQQLMDAGTEPAPGTPAEMAAQIKREIDLTSRLIKSAGIKIE